MSPNEPDTPAPVEPGQAKRGRLVVSLLALALFTGLALVGWVWWRGQQPAAGASVTGATPPSATADAPTAATTAVGTVAEATVAVATDVPGDGFGIVVGLATPWAVPGGPGEPTATATTAPALPPASITLLGPPAGSLFRPQDVVSFYWSSPAVPGQGQQYVVYLATADGQTPLGVVNAANYGQGYYLQAAPGSVGETGQFSWSVVLQDGSNGDILGASESRALTIMAVN